MLFESQQFCGVELLFKRGRNIPAGQRERKAPTSVWSGGVVGKPRVAERRGARAAGPQHRNLAGILQRVTGEEVPEKRLK